VEEFKSQAFHVFLPVVKYRAISFISYLIYEIMWHSYHALFLQFENVYHLFDAVNFLVDNSLQLKKNNNVMCLKL